MQSDYHWKKTVQIDRLQIDQNRYQYVQHGYMLWLYETNYFDNATLYRRFLQIIFQTNMTTLVSQLVLFKYKLLML